MSQKPAERKKLRKTEDTTEKSTPKRKHRYYNNPQDKRVRARREIRGPR